ncbi:hypothetical protein NQ317_004195 [Molorchus minor]|uniref:Uncharacterized protein n=1 Tax=Molorchus minor TaxID=1323400 RepID=A0ABQ9JCI1_9CUCU|nr:hypothetical protein NQ317_004195 [Molorchus minor]
MSEYIFSRILYILGHMKQVEKGLIDNAKKPLETYELQTVTYGTKSRVFWQFGACFNLRRELYPDLSDIIQRDFYVDDMLTGCESIKEALYICQVRKFSNIFQKTESLRKL